MRVDGVLSPRWMAVRGKRGRSVNREIRKGPKVITGFVCPACNSARESLNISISLKWRKIMRYDIIGKLRLCKFDIFLSFSQWLTSAWWACCCLWARVGFCDSRFSAAVSWVPRVVVLPFGMRLHALCRHYRTAWACPVLGPVNTDINIDMSQGQVSI